MRTRAVFAPKLAAFARKQGSVPTGGRNSAAGTGRSSGARTASPAPSERLVLCAHRGVPASPWGQCVPCLYVPGAVLVERCAPCGDLHSIEAHGIDRALGTAVAALGLPPIVGRAVEIVAGAK